VRDHYNPLITVLSQLRIPTIAAVNGSAAGAGLGIACAADFRIGAPARGTPPPSPASG
jgi:2-(1,2-epoxy-1,2-dihydrophenyl)acetyl-CoA isomerase